MAAAAKKTTTTAKKKITVPMKFERSTKGTHVFTAEDEAAAVPTLYVRKSGLDPQPDEITLTIEYA